MQDLACCNLAACKVYHAEPLGTKGRGEVLMVICRAWTHLAPPGLLQPCSSLSVSFVRTGRKFHSALVQAFDWEFVMIGQPRAAKPSQDQSRPRSAWAAEAAPSEKWPGFFDCVLWSRSVLPARLVAACVPTMPECTCTEYSIHTLKSKSCENSGHVQGFFLVH